jgi:hypothetical protein
MTLHPRGAPGLVQKATFSDGSDPGQKFARCVSLKLVTSLQTADDDLLEKIVLLQ